MHFGLASATIKSVNAAGTLATVTSPAHASGVVDITVTARGITSSTLSADQFTYTGPVITSLSAASGPTAGGARSQDPRHRVRRCHLGGLRRHAGHDVLKANKAGTLLTVTVPARAARAP